MAGLSDDKYLNDESGALAYRTLGLDRPLKAKDDSMQIIGGSIS
jgi:hypothetical protein